LLHTIAVYLVGGSADYLGNVFAYNPETGVDGPVCDDGWDYDDVSCIMRLYKYAILNQKKLRFKIFETRLLEQPCIESCSVSRKSKKYLHSFETDNILE
jgi:hypothetical protein